jgi:hypothetical protein
VIDVTARPFYASTNPAVDSTVAIQAALTVALAARSALYFPKGTFNFTTPLELDERVEIFGCGEQSILKYSGSGAAIRGEFPSATTGEFSSFHHFQLRGTNASGQSGIIMGTNLQGVVRCSFHHILTEDFNKGYGIYLQRPIDTEIVRCRIGASQTGILLHTPAGNLVSDNYMSYWANAGIHLMSVDNALAPRNNTVTRNLVHGNGVVSPLVLLDRAGIKITRVSSTDVVNNYLEIINNPVGATTERGHGVWIEGTAGLTQMNSVEKNYFGPGLTGDAIRTSGLASHTVIGGNQVSTYNINDAGLYSVFNMQYLPDIAQLTGVSTTRSGWIKLVPGGTNVQLHA